MPAIDSVIFDWGNTLVDYPLETAAQQVRWLSLFLHDMARQLGDPLQTEMERLADNEEALYKFNQELPDHAVRGFERRLKETLLIGVSARIASAMEQQLCERLFGSARVVEGADEVVSHLHRKGLRIGIVSNTPWGTSREQWKKELESYEFFRKSCGAVVFCQDVGFRKPHPAPFTSCLLRLQSRPDKTLVVGDSLNSDMAGAHAAGCRGLWFDRKHSHTSAPGQPSISLLADIPALINKT